MKYTLAVLSLCILSLNYNVEAKMNIEGVKKMMKGLKTPCMTQSGATEEQLEATHRGEFAREPELMCFYKCIFQKMKVIQGGKLSLESAKLQMKTLLDESILPQISAVIEKCEKLAVNDDLCQGAFDYAECSFKENPDVYFFP